MKTNAILLSLALFAVLLVGCGTSSNLNTGAYLAGRVAYPGLTEGAKQIMDEAKMNQMVDELEARYKKFLDDTAGTDTIEPDVSVAFFNDLILTTLAYVDDPYFLLSDLTFILSQYGAQFTQNEDQPVKLMTAIQPIPRSAYAAFDIGWHVSKRMMAKK